ncbi:hypothetical protein [Nocardia sp. NPDC005366]|uniref:hypothetical protein n=1 Tax=Nocardia sp. NPDC005366 TaxID=3156878 RepID=UPI0033A5DF92
MRFGPGHPLAYPIAVTIGALAIVTAASPFGDTDQRAALVTVGVVILGYTVIRLATAYGAVPCGLGPAGTVDIARIRQQHRLVSRSWLEITAPEPIGARWLPIYFDRALLTLTETAAENTGRGLRAADLRLYPSGRARTAEPPGRLIDNPSRPDPEAKALAIAATRPARRLLLDAQSAVAAPFAGLLWIYIDGGGIVTFLLATSVAAATAVWLSAIRGSDPS